MLGGRIKAWRASLEGKFEPWSINLMLGGLIEGPEGRFEVWRSDLRLGGS